MSGTVIPPLSDPQNVDKIDITSHCVDTSTYSPPPLDLHQFANANCELACKDDCNFEGIGPQQFFPVKIVDLFDFWQTFWAEKLQASRQQGFDQELAIYELLDLDAAGDKEEAEDEAIEVNASTQDILLWSNVKS